MNSSEGHISEVMKGLPPNVPTAKARNITGDLSSYMGSMLESKRKASRDDDNPLPGSDIQSSISINKKDADDLKGKLKGVREPCDTIASEISSHDLNDIQKRVRDINDKQVLLTLTEASTLTPVSVKLEIDFDAILKLQRKLSHYSDHRIQNVLPLVIFDDFKHECEEIQKEIVRRRKNAIDPILVTVTFKDEFDKR